MSKRSQQLKAKNKKKKLGSSSSALSNLPTSKTMIPNSRRAPRLRQIGRYDPQRAITLAASRLTMDDVRLYKEEMQKIIDYANKRIDILHEKGLDTVELHRFQEGDSNKHFKLPSTNNPNTLRAYMTQVRVVLSSITESSNTPLLETAMMESAWYKGQFGNQYAGTRYNVHDVLDEEGNIIRRAIDSDIASKAFEAYRNLEQEYGPIIGRQGQEGVYGSENLIIAIYDYMERGMDGQLYGKQLLEAWQDDFIKEMEGINFSLDKATAIISQWDDFVSTRWF